MSDQIETELSNDEKAAQLEGTLYADGSTPEVVTEAPAVVVPPVATVTPEVPAVVATEVKTEGEGEGEASGRFRLSGKPAAFAQLIKEGIPEAEAVQRIYGAAQTPEAATTTEQEEENTAPDPFAEQRAELADLQTQLAAAADDQSLFTPELMQMQERAADLKLEIKLGEKDAKALEVQQEQSADAAFDAQYDANEKAALAEYPDAGDVSTPLGKLTQKLAKAAALDPETPKGDPTIIAKVIAEAAETLGIKPVSAQQGGSPQTPAAVTTTAKTPVIAPVSGAERTAPSVTPNQATESAALADRLAKASSPAEKEAILNEGLYGAGQSTVSGFSMA